MNTKTEWQEIFTLVSNLLPRVGRRQIADNQVLQRIQQLIPEKEVCRVIACRGTNRSLGPPQNLSVGEAPFRRGIYQERNSEQISIDEHWENWEQLSQRQLTRPAPASRISITVFAANRSAEPAAKADSSIGEEKTSLVDQSKPESIPQTTPEELSLSKSQLADLQNKHQPASFQQIPKNEQAAILRAHRNLGHPSPEKLATILKQQGFRPEVVKAAAELKCSTCEATAEPKHARPSTLRDDLDFNDRISIDGFNWTNSQGHSVSCLST